jgi:metal-responsive CopG/Arc/MetJ family transcriptional regulator
MAINTVNISFQSELLKKIDQAAKAESRTRSELIREAARMYIDKKDRLERLFEAGDAAAEKLNISEQDVIDEITAYRKEKA